MIYEYIDTLQLNEKIDIFENIFSHLHELFNTLEFDEFQRIIIRQIIDLVECERALLFIIKEDTHELVSKDIFDTAARAMVMPIDNNSIAGYCVNSGLILNLDDIEKFSDICKCPFKFNPHYDRIYGFKTRNVISVPVYFGDKVVGVLQALNKKEAVFAKRDEVLLEKYAHLIAGILVWRQQIEDLRTLEMLEREKAQFIRILVHELKSPVSAVVGLLDMALQPEGIVSAERKQNYIERSKVRAEHMIKTIKDLLVIHDLKEKSVSPGTEVLSVDHVVNKQIEEFRDSTATKKIKIHYVIEGDDFKVRGNPTLIPLIFSNLISNAIKYSRPDGQIEIRIVGKKKYLYFSIQDHGIGIPEKDHKRLFKEFYRASNAKKLKLEGTGLGLVAVKQIVEMHHGKIYFKSRENEGTWFMIRLPLAADFVVVY